mmetsp:Transcript_88035/g.188915  ORF Transcript_88035/g.188915 Transcript_88035/m.188915 type:complete len:280 (+) Transcript_88035:811-1650(+)
MRRQMRRPWRHRKQRLSPGTLLRFQASAWLSRTPSSTWRLPAGLRPWVAHGPALGAAAYAFSARTRPCRVQATARASSRRMTGGRHLRTARPWPVPPAALRQAMEEAWTACRNIGALSAASSLRNRTSPRMSRRRAQRSAIRTHRCWKDRRARGPGVLPSALWTSSSRKRWPRATTQNMLRKQLLRSWRSGRSRHRRRVFAAPTSSSRTPSSKSRIQRSGSDGPLFAQCTRLRGDWTPCASEFHTRHGGAQCVIPREHPRDADPHPLVFKVYIWRPHIY